MALGRPKKSKGEDDPYKKLTEMMAEMSSPSFSVMDNLKAADLLTPNDLQKSLEQVRVNYELQQRQEQMQRQLQNSSTGALAQLQNQLSQRGVGNLASGLQWGGSGQSMPRNNPVPDMQPVPKFLEGYRVTVRTGKVVWTVHHFEERSDPYSGRTVRLYYLEDIAGKQTREVEEDLRIYETDAVKPATKATVDFDTVIIPDEKRQQILEAIEQVNQTDLIFEHWGFGETIEKGKGVSMLFYGPPGTGKTLMAQAIANKLGKTLSVISTADIESSSPGESERNIRKHFKDAGDGKSILLFDECDSLIYTRAGVGPIMAAQINELLSQIERFNGITIFTTNRLGTLDEAVNRRLALKLEFEMPTVEERALIWQRMFPKKAPLAADIDWARLAIVEITGGYIKNAVLRAARMAAIEKIPDKRKKIKMEHLVKAIRQETQAMIDFEDARDAHNSKGATVAGPDGLSRTTGRKVIHKVEKVEGNA